MPLIKSINLFGIIAILILQAPRSAMGQQTKLETGALVRISAPEMYDGRFIGMVNEINEDFLIAESDYEELVIEFPFTAINRIDISAGKRDGIKEGLLAGLAAAAFSGITSYAYLEEKRTPPPCKYLICVRKNRLFTKEDSPKIALWSGLSVAFLAFVIARKSQKWERVPVHILLYQSYMGALNNHDKPVITLQIPIGMK
jgi:hypothetical protein